VYEYQRAPHSNECNRGVRRARGRPLVLWASRFRAVHVGNEGYRQRTYPAMSAASLVGSRLHVANRFIV
jgi:hypothetical protein